VAIQYRLENPLGRLLKKTHGLRRARSFHCDVLAMHAPLNLSSAKPKDRFFARFAFEIFLSSLHPELFSKLQGSLIERKS
jgi:hypothetical protein